MTTTTERYIICIFKDADRIVQLHTDKHFYGSIICVRGCNPVEYKTRKKAEQVARTYSRNSWGCAFACTYEEKDKLHNSIQGVYGTEKETHFSECANRLGITLFKI
jgi:hypothetical protein